MFSNKICLPACTVWLRLRLVIRCAQNACRRTKKRGILPLLKNWECINRHENYWFPSLCVTQIKTTTSLSECVRMYECACEFATNMDDMKYQSNVDFLIWVFQFSKSNRFFSLSFISFDVASGNELRLRRRRRGRRNMVDKQFYPTLNGVTLEILTIWFNSLAQRYWWSVFNRSVKQSFKYMYIRIKMLPDNCLNCIFLVKAADSNFQHELKQKRETCWLICEKCAVYKRLLILFSFPFPFQPFIRFPLHSIYWHGVDLQCCCYVFFWKLFERIDLSWN